MALSADEEARLRRQFAAMSEHDFLVLRDYLQVLKRFSDVEELDRLREAIGTEEDAHSLIRAVKRSRDRQRWRRGLFDGLGSFAKYLAAVWAGLMVLKAAGVETWQAAQWLWDAFRGQP